MTRLIAFLFLPLLLTGCLSAERTLDRSAVDQIKAKTWTRAEVERHFGKPGSVVTGSNGKSVADYEYVMISPASPNLERTVTTRSLSVLYDRQGVVENFVHNENKRVVEQKMNGTSVGSRLDVIDWIIKGRTRMNMITEVYGPPDFKALTPEGQVVVGWIYFSKGRGQLNGNFERFVVASDDHGIVQDFRMYSHQIP